jgi:hypothetical protein
MLLIVEDRHRPQVRIAGDEPAALEYLRPRCGHGPNGPTGWFSPDGQQAGSGDNEADRVEHQCRGGANRLGHQATGTPTTDACRRCAALQFGVAFDQFGDCDQRRQVHLVSGSEEHVGYPGDQRHNADLPDGQDT